MTSSNEKLNNDSEQELTNDIVINSDPAPIDDNPAPVDEAEVTATEAIPSQPSESPTLPIEPLPHVEPDLLFGFDPDDYKDSVEGEDRYRILDLYLGYLCGKPHNYDKIKIRSLLEPWDRANRPPLGIKEIWAYIKANHAKWLRYHYIHRTGTWAGVS